jgi:hypothetical protein
MDRANHVAAMSDREKKYQDMVPQPAGSSRGLRSDAAHSLSIFSTPWERQQNTRRTKLSIIASNPTMLVRDTRGLE